MNLTFYDLEGCVQASLHDSFTRQGHLIISSVKGDACIASEYIVEFLIVDLDVVMAARATVAFGSCGYEVFNAVFAYYARIVALYL